MRCFCAAVHRLPAIGSPARLTTAPAPSISEAHAPISPLGFHRTTRAPPESRGSRVRMTRSCPSPASAVVSGRPRKPVPPAMMIFMTCLSNPKVAGNIPARLTSENRVDHADLEDELIGPRLPHIGAGGGFDGDVRPG